MRVFVAGATGVTRSTARAAALQAAGATSVIVDGLDRRAVLDAVKAAQPAVIVQRDPLDPDPVPAARQSMAAIKHVEEAVPGAVPEGLVLRYGYLYGHGASDNMLVVSLMTQVRGSANEKAKRELGWAPQYASRRDGFPAWAKTAEHGRAA